MNDNQENKEYQITGFDVAYHNNSLYYTGGVINALFHQKEGVYFNRVNFKQELSPRGDHRSWVRVYSFEPPRFNHVSVVIGDQLCVFGGASKSLKNTFETEPLGMTSISQIGRTGLMGWRYIHDKNVNLGVFKRVVSVGRNVYIFPMKLGGKPAGRLMWHLMADDKRLAAGVPLCELPQLTWEGNVCAHNNWIYLLGGERCDQLYACEVEPSGRLTPWKLVKTLKRPMHANTMIVFKNQLYIFSGSGRMSMCAELMDKGYVGEPYYFANPLQTSLRRPIILELKETQKLLFVKSLRINDNLQNPKVTSEVYLGDFDLLPETIEFTPIGV